MGIKNFGLETPEYYNTALNRLPGPTRHWFTGFIDPLVKNYSALSSIRYYRLRLRGTISYYFLFCIRNCHSALENRTAWYKVVFRIKEKVFGTTRYCV